MSEFVCGDTRSFEVVAGTAYTIRLEALGGQGTLQDVSYTLSLYGSAAR